MPLETPIIAAATPPGSAMRGIIRLAGENVYSFLPALFLQGQSAPLPSAPPESPRIFTGSLCLWMPQRSVPAKIFYWPHARGYTGQETVEIHTVSNPAFLDAVVQTFLRTEKIRLAEPGEFTMRAFLNGKLDLTQAEAVLAVIDAKTPSELTVALKQLAGNVAQPIAEIRENLLNLLVALEASMDFAEEDISFISEQDLQSAIKSAHRKTEKIFSQLQARTHFHETPLILLVGQPNAGKSTLFNTLLKSQRALVSPLSGTTRDYLESPITLGSWSCRLVDTAGLDVGQAGEPTQKSPIDAQAQHAALELAKQADIIVCCREPKNEHIELATSPSCAVIHVRTKSCVANSVADAEDMLQLGEIAVSALENQGIGVLREVLVQMLAKRATAGEVLPGTALRCLETLDKAVKSLEETLLMLESKNGDESLVAAQIRYTIDHLGLVDGTLHTEDILERLFSHFCVGK